MSDLVDPRKAVRTGSASDDHTCPHCGERFAEHEKARTGIAWVDGYYTVSQDGTAYLCPTPTLPVISIKDVLSVFCPYCGVNKGERCRSAITWKESRRVIPSTPHWGRRQLAKRRGK